MKVSLISYTPDAARLLVFTKGTRLSVSAARWDDVQEMGSQELAEELAYMANTIPSSWEFVDYVFAVEGVSRAYTHQQVRTRAGSYAQQSLRVTDLSGGFDYVHTDRNKEDDVAMMLINDHLVAVEQLYAALIAIGQPPEDARGILPTNIATNIVCKFNLRTMAELARSRTGGRTQGEYQAVVGGMVDEVLRVHPWASAFLFPKGRAYFDELEEFAKKEWPDDLLKRGALLKIVDRMRKEA